MIDDEKTWLTPHAHQKLAGELDRLSTVGRREIEDRIAEARDHGDLRENAEYDTAKNDQGLMEARIRQIKQVLENAEITEVTDTGRIEIGTIAAVVDDDGNEMEFFIAPRREQGARHPACLARQSTRRRPHRCGSWRRRHVRRARWHLHLQGDRCPRLRGLSAGPDERHDGS